MSLDTLPTELITQIFFSLPTITSVLNLASASHHFNHIYNLPSNRLPILASAADTEYGPLPDLISLVTHNASHSTHLSNPNVPISIPLLQQIIHVGGIAHRYADEIYPVRRWKTDFASRRLLCNHERFALRRALYRVWLYGRAFHNAARQPRTCRTTTEAMRARCGLVGRWSTAEVAEMVDVWEVVRELVAGKVVPSSGKVRRGLRKRFGGDGDWVGCSIHLNYPVERSGGRGGNWGGQARLLSDLYGEGGWGVEGWGDDIQHYYVVEDMMKLDPEQLLYLKDHCPLKSQVEEYVRELGHWFSNNGETFSETAAMVLRQRGEDISALRAELELGEAGIVKPRDD